MASGGGWMSSAMRAMVVKNWGEPFTLEERPDPAPGPGEAVMKVRAAGVGLTLVTMRSGVFGGEAPRVMGHELGGDIVAVGEGVSHVAVGDRCAVYFYLNCGHCRWCRNGRETLCENHGGYVGVHAASTTETGWPGTGACSGTTPGS